MARAAGVAIIVKFSRRLLAVNPTPSPLLKLKMQLSLSLPVSKKPGGRTIEYGLSTEVCSCRLHGSGCARAFARSTSDSMGLVRMLIPYSLPPLTGRIRCPELQEFAQRSMTANGQNRPSGIVAFEIHESEVR